MKRALAIVAAAVATASLAGCSLDSKNDSADTVRVVGLIRGKRLVDATPLLPRVPGGTRHGGRERQGGQRGHILASQHQSGGILKPRQGRAFPQ